MGRPAIEIDKNHFESLCGLQCTLPEIADFFSCSEDTIERWCRRTYNDSFAEVFKKKSGKGRISIRRAQFKLAEKNASMAIWLGKNYLGQSDEASYNPTTKREDDALTKALKEEAERMNNGDLS